MRRALLALVGMTTVARADGWYFSQSLGLASSDEPSIGRAIRTRASLGVRHRWLAIEPWLTSDTQYSRDGGWSVIGGEPLAGRSDLAYYGVDVKLIAPLQRTRGSLAEGYLRTGASYVTGNGALAGYSGYGLGAAAGLQLRGRVRALGFVWTPLFWIKRGPKVTGALFAEYGVERVDFGMSTTRVGHSTLGFAIGSSF